MGNGGWKSQASNHGLVCLVTSSQPETFQEPAQSHPNRAKDAPSALHLGMYKGFRSSVPRIRDREQYKNLSHIFQHSKTSHQIFLMGRGFEQKLHRRSYWIVNKHMKGCSIFIMLIIMRRKLEPQWDAPIYSLRCLTLNKAKSIGKDMEQLELSHMPEEIQNGKTTTENVNIYLPCDPAMVVAA